MKNDIDWQPICDYFKLGQLDSTKPLKGGRSHTIYLVITSQGKFVIKQLLSHHGKPVPLDIFRNTAAIAHLFLNKGIASVAPLIKNNDVILEYNNNYYMAYPYVAAVMLPHCAYTLEHCQRTGELLAQMHNLNLEVPATPLWKFQYQANDWQQAYDFFLKREIYSIAPKLKKLDSVIQHCFIEYERLLPEIVADVVVSHRDIDTRNLLWRSPSEAMLIDWDLAGNIDAAVEFMYVALGLAMESKNTFIDERFTTILNSYMAIRPLKTKNVEALLYATLCNWLVWCQGQMHKLVLGQDDLATANEIAVGVRHSLDAMEYVMSIFNLIKNLWNH